MKKARRQVSRRIWIRGRGLFRNSRYRWLPLSHGSVPNCLGSSYSTWMAPEFFRCNWRHRRLSELFFLVDPRGYPLSPALNPRLIQVVIWSNSPRCGGLGAGIVSSLSKLHPLGGCRLSHTTSRTERARVVMGYLTLGVRGSSGRNPVSVIKAQEQTIFSAI